MLIDTPVNKITHEILAAAIEVHRVLGPGLFERVYEPCFYYELGVRKRQFETHRAVPILYKGMQFGGTYHADLIVEGSIVVEMKCVAALLPVHSAQALTYMKLTNCPYGLLINASRRAFTASKSGCFWITKSRPVGAFFPNRSSPRKFLRNVQLKSLPARICF